MVGLLNIYVAPFSILVDLCSVSFACAFMIEWCIR